MNATTLREMMGKATPTPWYDDGYRIYGPTVSDDKRDGEMIVEYKHVEKSNPNDGTMIVAAVNLFGPLLDVLEAAEKAGQTIPHKHACRGGEKCPGCEMIDAIAALYRRAGEVIS